MSRMSTLFCVAGALMFFSGYQALNSQPHRGNIRHRYVGMFTPEQMRAFEEEDEEEGLRQERPYAIFFTGYEVLGLIMLGAGAGSWLSDKLKSSN